MLLKIQCKPASLRKCLFLKQIDSDISPFSWPRAPAELAQHPSLQTPEEQQASFCKPASSQSRQNLQLFKQRCKVQYQSRQVRAHFLPKSHQDLKMGLNRWKSSSSMHWAPMNAFLGHLVFLRNLNYEEKPLRIRLTTTKNHPSLSISISKVCCPCSGVSKGNLFTDDWWLSFWQQKCVSQNMFLSI